YLVKQVGDEVSAGEAVATRRGWLGLSRRHCRAPQAGRLWQVMGRRVLLEGEPQVLEMHAYLRGRVAGVVGNLGVVVECPAAWVEGAWGCGGEDYGVLKPVCGPQDSLLAEAVDISCHGSVVVCGLVDDDKAVVQLAKNQARGIIAGSVDVRVLPVLAECGLPVVATEGLGHAPMPQFIYELLESHKGAEVSLLGVQPGPGDGARPEVVIPLSQAPAEAPAPPSGVELGARVRLLREPYRGRIGVITALPQHPQPVEVGRRRGARVDMEGGETAFVPWNNLELIG
ncbi:MAG: hypothetical protein GX605_09405, partial [Chloroflexi bacterium]|nr:hypothetical protein [Chloroflexota bacterium]